MTKICNGINSTTPIVNAISFLYEEELIDIDELIKLVIDFTKKKYLNCINHKILFDIYIHPWKSQGTSQFDELYANISQIFENLFSEKSREYHSHLYRCFIDLVMRNNIMSGLLYKLLQNPLSFKPYEELLASVWNSVKIQVNVTE